MLLGLGLWVLLVLVLVLFAYVGYDADDPRLDFSFFAVKAGAKPLVPEDLFPTAVSCVC